VPIVHKKAKDCVDEFRAHLAKIFASTLTTTGVLQTRKGTSAVAAVEMRVSLGFYQGEKPVTIPLATKYGDLELHLAQQLDVVPHEDSSYRLMTRRYWYRLSKPSKEEPLFRWEYVTKDGANTDPPRHHVHMHGALHDAPDLDPKHLHIPTGWVTIEEVLRFVIVELGFKPPRGDEWPKILAESEKVFYTKFTGKRS
jgi:hypothetical protein